MAAAKVGEAPFALLSNALIEQDVEQKAAILKLVNSLLLALKDNDDVSAQFTFDLSLQFFEERYEEALNLVDSAIDDVSNTAAAKKATPSSIDSATSVNFEDVYKNIGTPCSGNRLDVHEETLGYGLYQYEENKFSADNPGFFSPLKSHGLQGINPMSTLKKQVSTRNWHSSPAYPPSKSIEIASGSAGFEVEDIYGSYLKPDYETFEVRTKVKTVTVCPQDGSMVRCGGALWLRSNVLNIITIIIIGGIFAYNKIDEADLDIYEENKDEVVRGRQPEFSKFGQWTRRDNRKHDLDLEPNRHSRELR